MKIDDMAEHIRKLYSIISGTSDSDVIITFKGTGYGQTKPWHVRIAARENSSVSLEKALIELLDLLKLELKTKAAGAEQQAKNYRQALSGLEN